MAQVIALAGGTLTTTLTKIAGPVPSGEQWVVDVRGVVSGTADSDTVDLQVRNGAFSAYRAKGFPLAKGAEPYDLEYQLPLPAGSEIWARSGSASTIDLSVSGTRYADPV